MKPLAFLRASYLSSRCRKTPEDQAGYDKMKEKGVLKLPGSSKKLTKALQYLEDETAP
jgi:hypothetical protein